VDNLVFRAAYPSDTQVLPDFLSGHGHPIHRNYHRLWTLHPVVTQSQPPTFSTAMVWYEAWKFNSLLPIHSIHWAYSYSYYYDGLSLVQIF